ncbi:phage head-tail connector protein [Qipengyuania nanhaisediminis]|uniref:head-tail connector protein n=1 Tax=Qipengyuania nanhaisediminis TaxID=604088 RepID=UPI0038B231E9
MRRTTIEPADLTGPALADLKAWLGISRPNEDDLLLDLLRASHDTLTAYIGQSALTETIEEWVSPTPGEVELGSRPVTSLVSAEAVVPGENRQALDPGDFTLDIDAEGIARFTLHSMFEAQALAIRVRAGIAASWNEVPPALGQGMVRLAAYLYRDRDSTGGDRSGNSPPPSVVSLWRPWRGTRLA